MDQPRPESPTAALPEDAVTLLDRDGTLHRDERFARYLPYLDALSDETLRQMYRWMVTTRRLDREGTSLQRQGQLSLWVPSIGQEGAQAGAMAALGDQDWVFPTYREHLMALARGVTPRELMILFRGGAHSGWDPEQYRVQPYTLVLAAQTLHGTGYAWGIQRDQADWDAERIAAEGQVSLICFGDGASSEGDVHESMVFAASYDLPVVFFCQNNHWAISVPSSTQTRVPLAQRAAGYGFEGVTVDGNDPLAVYAVTAWAAEQSRTGKGPVLVEADTYRMGAHTTADDPTKYRSGEEEQAFSALDPLARLETYLRSTGVLTDEFAAEVAEGSEALAAETRQAVLGMTAETLGTLDDMFEHTYAEPHPLIDEERAWYHEWQAGFADLQTPPTVAGGEGNVQVDGPEGTPA